MIKIEAKPILKWAGGKSKLIPIMEESYPNDLKNNKIKRYVEPFIGGGAMFFSLTSKYYFDEIIINDINKELILTYKVVKEYPNDLIDLLTNYQNEYNELEKIEDKQEYFYRIRELFNNGKDNINYDSISIKEIEHAAYMIFLNKSCFNGLYRENKKGLFNVPFGKRDKLNTFDKDSILKASEILKNAIILNGDFEELEKYIDESTFVYMDPPYRPLNATSSFNDYSKESFNDDSQIRLRDFYKRLSDKGAKLMLSNSDPKNTDEEDNFFDDLYNDFNIQRIYASRSINSKATGRGKVSEILVTNY